MTEPLHDEDGAPNPCRCGHDRSDHNRGYFHDTWQYLNCWGETPDGCPCLSYEKPEERP